MSLPSLRDSCRFVRETHLCIRWELCRVSWHNFKITWVEMPWFLCNSWLCLLLHQTLTAPADNAWHHTLQTEARFCRLRQDLYKFIIYSVIPYRFVWCKFLIFFLKKWLLHLQRSCSCLKNLVWTKNAKACPSPLFMWSATWPSYCSTQNL